MKNRILDQSHIEPNLRQDYINIDHTVAISAEGVIFKIGDIVSHSGAEKKNETAIISMFSIHHGTKDIIAHTGKGYGRISFMYHPK